ncbi:enoyl-CoA hydratase/isomerase family protein [Streptomyces shenzhenensis]|uniref:enoyl-CoA hydratase n=1 Tax=Streptomyces shenzhenensis TaxID=943815 RepID=A0A3M0HVF2_9ACTN|nr:enoyl-CoA hydratase/isomerase family protein [Streptomyces shenzhenensis]RMB80555.1 enoyl-CoA hydratase [Streptomyces shenzhenensis]
MTVHLEVSDSVGVIRVARPPMNALDTATLDALRTAAEEAACRSDVRAVVLWGGQTFGIGADIAEMQAMGYEDMAVRVRAFQDAFTSVTRIPKPVVAGVAGYALGGGCELALCADIRIAAEDARFGLPEILLGLMPGGGGTQRLARLIGPSRAKELIFTGRTVQAPEAHAFGLIDHVVPADRVYAEAHAWAAQMARGPQLALRAAKEAIDAGLKTSLEAGLAIERGLFAGLFATEDRETGMRSFIEQGPGRARFGSYSPTDL